MLINQESQHSKTEEFRNTQHSRAGGAAPEDEKEEALQQGDIHSSKQGLSAQKLVSGIQDLTQGDTERVGRRGSNSLRASTGFLRTPPPPVKKPPRPSEEAAHLLLPLLNKAS